MEILVFGIQVLSLALVVWGAWLSAWVAHRDWLEADDRPRFAEGESVPATSPAESDAEETSVA